VTKILALVAAILLVAGCSGAAAPELRSYDLGLAAPAGTLPPARIAQVRAAAPFDSIDMQYRLAYRDAGEIAAFANSRWAATPAELLRKQLLRAANERPGRCTVEVEIQEFTQVFSAKDASEARIDLRAWVRGGAARSWSVAEPNAGANAASGAAAFARAANRAVGELGVWIASQPDCK
jgi:cholesterol transport system auxiliary component